MRSYCTVVNLGKSAGLSAAVTMMAVGRLSQGHMPLAAYIPLTFVAMVLVTGAVTAWGTQAGMPGVVTDRGTFLRGALLALALALVSVAAHRLGGNAFLRELLQDPRHALVLELTLPSTLQGQLSLVLWSAGIQVMILMAAPMSLFARITRNRWLALGLCLALRAYVVHQQMVYAGITDGAPWFLTSALLSTATGCFLFARFGLGPAMLFAAAAEL